MNKSTKSALTIYSSMSFGVSLDDLVDFANSLNVGETFVYQSILYTPEGFIHRVIGPTKIWLEKNLPKYETIIETYQVLVNTYDNMPKSEREAKLNAFLDTYGDTHRDELEDFDLLEDFN